MEKLIVTETFSHADGEYRITYSTADEPALKRASGSTPALVATVELERHGSRELVYRWAFVPIPGQRTLSEFTLATPQVARIASTLSTEELNSHLNKVYGTLEKQLRTELRAEPLPWWKTIVAILLLDLAFSSALVHVRIPWFWIGILQLPILLFSICFYAIAQWIDRKFTS